MAPWQWQSQRAGQTEGASGQTLPRPEWPCAQENRPGHGLRTDRAKKQALTAELQHYALLSPSPHPNTPPHPTSAPHRPHPTRPTQRSRTGSPRAAASSAAASSASAVRRASHCAASPASDPSGSTSPCRWVNREMQKLWDTTICKDDFRKPCNHAGMACLVQRPECSECIQPQRTRGQLRSERGSAQPTRPSAAPRLYNKCRAGAKGAALPVSRSNLLEA